MVPTSSLDQRTFLKLRRLYILALSTIAIAVIFGQLFIGKFLEEQEGDSHLINLAGRQRMLSQKITSEALLLVRSANAEERLNRLDSLDQAFAEFSKGHQELQEIPYENLTKEPSWEIRESFLRLQPFYDAMVTAMAQMSTRYTRDPRDFPNETDLGINNLLKYQRLFLKEMEAMVAQYDREAHLRVKRLQQLELFLTLVILIILILEFLFIFLPTAKGVKNNLRNLMQAEEKALAMAKDADALSEAREKSVKELRALGTAMDKILLFARISPTGEILHIGEKFSRLFGFRNRSIERKFSELLSSKKNEQLIIEQLISSHKRSGWQGEVKATTKEAIDVWLELSLVPFQPEEEKTELIIIGVDITKAKEAQIQVEDLTRKSYEEKMRQQNLIAQRIIENQENEQNRIAKDIHDGIGQMLTGLKFNLESIDLDEPEKARTKIENLKDLSLQILKGVRAATFNLTPPELSDHGIVPALEKLTSELSKLTGKKIILFNKTGFNERLDNICEINLYRITQEAVNNAIKYAESSHIIISVSHSRNILSISIEDNGRGFDLQEVAGDKRNKGGMGLTFMRERVKFIHARIFINSAPGEGTRVTLNLPLEKI